MNKCCDKCDRLYNIIMDFCPHCASGNDHTLTLHLGGAKVKVKGFSREIVTKDLGGWCKATNGFTGVAMPNRVPTKRTGRAIPTVRSIIKTKEPATSRWTPFDQGKDWGIFGALLKRAHKEVHWDPYGDEELKKEKKEAKKRKKSVGELIQEAEARKAIPIEVEA